MGIFEVFYQPGKLFADLDQRRGAWFLPTILGSLLVLAVTMTLIRTVGMEALARQQIQNLRLSPEQMQLAMERATSPAQANITYVSTFVGAALALVCVAGLLMLFALMGSKQPKFGTNFSMVALAFFPYRVVVCLMTVLVLITAPDRATLDFTNLLATNVGAFVNKDAMSKGLYTLLSTIDILSFAEIGLLSYGFAKVNRTSVGFGLFAVLSLWIVYVLIRMALSLIF